MSAHRLPEGKVENVCQEIFNPHCQGDYFMNIAIVGYSWVHHFDPIMKKLSIKYCPYNTLSLYLDIINSYRMILYVINDEQDIMFLATSSISEVLFLDTCD